MKVEEISNLFESVPNFQNLYQVTSGSGNKVISYPSDAFGKTETENQGFWAQARLVAIKRAMKGNRATQLVEVGAGGGAVCIALSQDNFSIFAVEPHLNGAMTIAKGGVPVLAGFLSDADFPDGSVPNYGTFDVLEHLPDLVGAMTSCKKLLKTGGEMRIHVPYDLSYGAWQDPTHLRAFNEKSWLYYTDWHWYLGWEDRFYVTHLEFRLNPIAQDLKLTQEELLRTPRAVDSMYVVLQKGKK